MRLMLLIVTVIAALFISGCSSPTPPDGVTVVQDFNTQRYLGKWYEIARFDHSFERGLERVTATYSLRDDGGLTVVNRGYNTERDMWQQAIGTAYFTGNPRTAALKVSFFGPFYGGYNILALDSDYRYALVCGPDRDYLWILSRTPTLPADVKQQMLDIAARQGFAVEKLLWINQPH
ncbi:MULTISPECIES: outer membrane lipoprotein Blc [Kosakonia]|uniref:Outer membrane lipoprotein Blc n=1 Tax=Kosakonia quasisacchari TaxID=2529380 RepID=A0A4V2M0Y3_9ENTR|nr:outer membrane lipoprotein Blc [Kosakonia quasisacchari]TCC13856.1 outer membrane lipoprotein Blc [Kosakonia quasisacchari]